MRQTRKNAFMPFTSASDVSGLPGAFQAALHGVLTATRYETAVRDTMSCGGCTCSRGSFIGACLGAQVGLSANLIYSRAHILSLIYEMFCSHFSRSDLRESRSPGSPRPCNTTWCWSIPRR